MGRRVSGVVLFLLATNLAPAAPVPTVPADPLPRGATARLGSLLYTGPNAHGLTFSADGKRLLARSDNNELLVWDSDTGKLLSTKAVTPPGLDRFLAARGYVQTVVTRERWVWLAQDSSRGQLDSEVVVCGLDGRVLNRFALQGQRGLALLGSYRDGFASIAVSADGCHLARFIGTEDRTAAIYDLNTGAILRSIKLGETTRASVSISREGKTVFVRPQGQQVRRYELPSGKELPLLEGTDDEVMQAEASPDGKWVVTGKYRTSKTVNGKRVEEDVTHLEVWDGQTGKRVGRLEVGGINNRFAFVGPGAVVVQSDKPRPLGATLSRWNLATLRREWDTPYSGSHFTIAPDGKRLATSRLGPLYLYDCENGKPLHTHRGHTGSVDWISFSGDGKTVHTAGGTEIITWGSNGELKQRVAVPELRTSGLVWLRGVGDHLVLRNISDDECRTPMVVGWDREKNAFGWSFFPNDWGQQAVATPDGKHVLCIVADSIKPVVRVAVYDGPAGTKVRQWSYPRPAEARSAPASAELSGDGRFVITSNGDAVTIWDAVTGTEKARVKVGQRKPPATFAVSRDGTRLVAVDDKTEVYEVVTGKLLARRSFPEGRFVSMKFRPDGKQLALWHVAKTRSGSALFVWDIDSAEAPLRRFDAGGEAAIYSVAFSPDGSRVAAGYRDGTALVWDLAAK